MLIAAWIAMLAVTALPMTGVLAYSHLYRDETDSCCVNLFNNWTFDHNYPFNGFDTSTDWATADYYSGGGPYIYYYPYPSSSPTYLCPFPHIANDSCSSGWVYWQDKAGSTNEVDQSSHKGWWMTAGAANFNTSDYVAQYSGPNNKYTRNTYSADVIDFHYNGC